MRGIAASIPSRGFSEGGFAREDARPGERASGNPLLAMPELGRAELGRALARSGGGFTLGDRSGCGINAAAFFFTGINCVGSSPKTPFFKCDAIGCGICEGEGE
jgi:hypothetical protein